MTDLASAFALRAIALPFFLTLIFAVALGRWRLSALGPAAGYAAAHVAVAGFGWPPAAAVPKLLCSALVASLAGLLLDRFAARGRWPSWALVATGAGLAVWVLGLALLRHPTGDAVAIACAVILYCGFAIAATDAGSGDAGRSGASLIGFAFATGGTVAFAGSGMIGELAVAAGACATAWFAVGLGAGGRAAPARAASFPLGLVVGLCGVMAWRLAALPWYWLALLAVVPAVAYLPLPRRLPGAARTALRLVFTLCMAGASIATVRYFEGGIPI